MKSTNYISIITGMKLVLLCSLFSCEKMKPEDHGMMHQASQDQEHHHDHMRMVKDSLGLETLASPVNAVVISSQRSVKPMFIASKRTIIARGYIAADERRNRKVAARFSGRIEKLFVKYNWQHVTNGETIMELYSAELQTYEEEYLHLIKVNSDTALINQAKEKLLLFGITEKQINTIARDRSVLPTIAIPSPLTGYVSFTQNESSLSTFDEKMPEADNSGMSMSSSNDNAASPVSTSTVQLREGDYVTKGQVLFTINDLQQVWGIIAVENNNASRLKIGGEVKLISELNSEDTIQTAINFVEPIYQPDQKFTTARVYLSNSRQVLKINSLLTGTIVTKQHLSLRIPYSSVLFLGRRKIVWVLKGKTEAGSRIYESRDVIVSGIDGNTVEIASGLDENDEVALNAGYLIDRESLIQPE